MMLAWFFANSPATERVATAGVRCCWSSCRLLIAKQPDLGGTVDRQFRFFVLFWPALLAHFVSCSRLRRRHPGGVVFQHEYQRQRVLTFLDPESDPLGAGYHIIQSKIAIGSGGLFGKGWLNGTQSQLEFLPERHTDFIFAVLAEEMGLVGALVLIGLNLFIIMRGLYIATRAQDSYARLLAGSLTLTFGVCWQFTGMVTSCASGRRAPAAGQRGWHLDGDPDGRIRYSDVHTHPP
jgi:rod shape determining protein RodA